MNAYSTIRNTTFATIIVAALAGIVSNALAVDQKIVYERDVRDGASITCAARGRRRRLRGSSGEPPNPSAGPQVRSHCRSVACAAFLPSSARHSDCEPVARHFITMDACSDPG
jgi:hypothetical protein